MIEEGRYELSPDRLELRELLRMVATGLRGLRNSPPAVMRQGSGNRRFVEEDGEGRLEDRGFEPLTC